MIIHVYICIKVYINPNTPIYLTKIETNRYVAYKGKFYAHKEE